MPPKAVRTVRDLIFWQYAKIIGKSSKFYREGDVSYGFVMGKFKELQAGAISWSDILREDLKMERQCAYCGSMEELSRDHIIPPRKLNPPPSCRQLFEIHNIIWACKKCNSSKGEKDLYEWYGVENRNKIPRVVEGKYLKLAYLCNECRGTLNQSDPNKDGRIDVFDIGCIFKTPCRS